VKKGQRVWEQILPGQPLVGGILLDREGKVVVVMENGEVLCYAAKLDDQSKAQAKKN
jgi:hypothetical protein